jgi:hypothetical protein
MAEKLQDPSEAARVARKRAVIAHLELRNRFSSEPVLSCNKGPVVSLTSYGKRLHRVHLAIESIARGQMLPFRLMLWLEDEEMVRRPSAPLVRLMRRGLEIRLCKDWGPHKKYYPYVASQDTFESPLATADDDVLYPSTWLQGLMAAHERFPKCVNCYRARRILLRAEKLAPYREWPLCASDEACPTVIATGVSGVIYPPALLAVLRKAGTAFESMCPRADDLWLHVQAMRAGYLVRQMQPAPVHFPHIPGSQDNSLYSQNCTQMDGNDRQFADTYDGRDLACLISGS